MATTGLFAVTSGALPQAGSPTQSGDTTVGGDDVIARAGHR